MNPQQSRGPMPESLRKRWEQALGDVNRTEIEAAFARCQTAATEPTFSGYLRRSIHAGGVPLSILASSSQVDASRIVAFLEGQGDLESSEIDRILQTLGLVATLSIHE